MPDYRGLSDDELKAKIVLYEARAEEILMGDGVAKIQGEGRLMEYVQANSGQLTAALEQLYYERSRRWPDLFPYRGRAIGVRFKSI
jgi:hypothetical protein